MCQFVSRVSTNKKKMPWIGERKYWVFTVLGLYIGVRYQC